MNTPTMWLTCGLLASATVTRAQNCGDLAQEILGPPDVGDYGADASLDGDTMAVAAFHAGFVYTRNSGEWELESELVPDAGEFLARGVELEGDFIIAAGSTCCEFAAFVFRREAPGVWVREFRIDEPVPIPDGGSFGEGAALDGDIALVGGDGSGVFEYRRQTNGTWELVATIEGSFGDRIALEGDTLVVGDGVVSSIYVYVRDINGAWVLTQTFENLPGLSALGYSVSISGDRIAAGAAFGLGPHRTAIFARTKLGEFELEQVVAGDQLFGGFGSSVAIEDGILIVGALCENNPGIPESGAAYVFTRDTQGLWTEQSRFVAPDAGPNHEVGFAAAIEGGIAVATTGDASQGAAYVLDVSTCAPTMCLADCDGNATLNVFDFLCFQGLVTTSDPLADCNADGSIDVFDFLCFQGLFITGCG